MNYTNEEMELMEENVQFISYKRTISCNYESITREMSIQVIPELEIDKQEKYIRDRVNYLLQQDMYMLENKKWNMQGFKKK
jgi:hypothetical protein